MAACLCVSCWPQARGQFVEWAAFNDQIAGAGTGPNATSWGVFSNSAGFLRDSATGATLGARLTITNNGASSASAMQAPDEGSAAATIFAGQIHWGSSNGEAVQLEGNDSVTYTFSGLEAGKRYTFRGTSVRGGSYANRWTTAEMQSASVATPAHTAGVATTASLSHLSGAQAVWNSGENRVGDVVGWDAIDPGEDGTFSVMTRRYSGDYPALGDQPAGNTESPTAAPYGYGFQAIRLEQWDPNPPGPPLAVPDSVRIHAGQKARLAVLANDTGLLTPSTVAVTAPPASGSAAVQPDGTILVTAGVVDTVFEYRVSGPGGESNAAAVSVAVADELRLAPLGFNLPASPPVTVWSVNSALGSLRFNQPLGMATPPGETRRLFVLEKGGLVRVVPDVTAAAPTATTFLNLPTLLGGRGESLVTSSEMGLLGLAFHPGYAANGYFYVFYSVRKSDGGNYERVSRFNVDPAAPALALPASELILIEQRDDATNHNGGDLHFGPDGYLYVTLGDEGNQNDSLNNSQTITKDFFSGILRIDVDRREGSVEPALHPAVMRDDGVARYAVPLDNPWVHTSLGGGWDGTFNGAAVGALGAVRSEFWAVGLRNPWRISFDAPTGELWCGDVGGSQREEVNIITRGGNYGWAFREGTINGPKSGSAPAGFTSIPPLHQYGHGSGPTQGNSISGGVVYRGERIPSLAGQYLFADYTSGNIWALRRNEPLAPIVTRLAGEGGIVGFGHDPSNGDVLLADIDSGMIRRLTASTPGGSFPQTLSATGLFADLTDLSPQPGLIPYAVNRPYWSDHAVKRRWLALPGTTAAIGWSRDGNWTFPAGTVWVEHFDLDLERGNPATRRRLETRLLVRTASGAYGVSYRWNEDGTEAALAPDEGVNVPLDVTENGQPAPQTWRIPSRAECLSCHTSQAGFALSSNTRQFNLDGSIHGFAGNQLDVLGLGGYFSNVPAPPNTLPRHPRPGESGVALEAQVRAWLAVNCSSCHRAGGPAPAGWDARPELSLAATGLIDGAVVNNGGNPLNRLVVAGQPDHSVVLLRAAAANGFTRMPAIATNLTDPEGVALLTAWISEVLPGREGFAAWRLRLFGSATDPAGDPAADPDADGHTNHAEFLAGTNPADGASAPALHATPDGDQLTIGFHIPDHRSWQVEWSPDLRDWSPWDAPGNHGLPLPAGPVTITGPVPAPSTFHRLRLQEN